ncbi:hypothetical protein BU24DRAFT_428705 [Aaosphaeria arxii CBS 175.79]|uniref:Uncharacterized protein n=1 Tax=Aaosphaeria arxii CBS 175.79 TaxID=1450172 RepID=A0A6A5X8D0_9PLEO|nr:uncharacterized protein BU24DRAFT_428705 [Aaosphaeria arxii CBS 175.79]KAF2009171.1 hypothetical protein BU24DRAFT_428705 [Aaosphaeria arxii CBS 175.79]
MGIRLWSSIPLHFEVLVGSNMRRLVEYQLQHQPPIILEHLRSPTKIVERPA